MEIKQYDRDYATMFESQSGAFVRYSDHLATVEALNKRIEELEVERRWIPVDMEAMKEGFECDLWEPHLGRLAYYRLVKDYAGKAGNNFFKPVVYGPSCIRTATHYMPLPKALQ